MFRHPPKPSGLLAVATLTDRTSLAPWNQSGHPPLDPARDPPPPASLSVTSGGRVSVYISGRQIIRLLLLPDIKNIRQAGRADTNPLLETAGNHFRQVNPPPWDGQLGTRKTVGGAGGGRTPSDTFRPVGGRHTDRPDAFGPVESARSSSRLDLRLRKRCQRGFFPCATASRSAPSSPSPCGLDPASGETRTTDTNDHFARLSLWFGPVLRGGQSGTWATKPPS